MTEELFTPRKSLKQLEKKIILNDINYYKYFGQLREIMNIIKDNLKMFGSEEVKKELYKDNKMIGKYYGTNYWTFMHFGF